MRVGDLSLGSSAVSDSNKTQETQRAGTTGGQRSSSSGITDEVQLSSTAGTLSGAVRSSSQERSLRIESLTASYQAGLYTPDLAGTASGLVTEALAGMGA
jgi:hypothetical protein